MFIYRLKLITYEFNEIVFYSTRLRFKREKKTINFYAYKSGINFSVPDMAYRRGP